MFGGVCMAKVVGIGKQRFDKIVENNCFYIDKTFWKNIKYGYGQMFFFG